MGKKSSLRSAKLLLERNLDRFKKPTAAGGIAVYTEERLVSHKGSSVKVRVYPVKRKGSM